MKNILSLAVLVGAVPALLFGQVTVDCPAETCQVAPYFQGTGGFVGESAGNDGDNAVRFFVICGNLTISSSVLPDADGIVRKALTEEEGLYCRAGDGGRLEFDNLKAGGWYWINDERNSAVSAMIPKDAVGNEQIVPVDPGGVIMTRVAGSVGTYARHPPTGRVGIIPHIVPARPAPGCSGAVGDATATDCHLGSAVGWSLAASPPRVIRPTGTDDAKEVTVRLMGTNFITTGDVYATAVAEFHSSVATVTFESRTGVVPEQGEPGVLQWTLTVGADDDRCLAANNDPDRLNEQTVTIAVGEVEEVIPSLGEDGLEVTFTVNCPSDSAARVAAELVPENPFPVDG